MKKGCVIKSTDSLAKIKINSLNVSWYYTWSLNKINGVDVPFVPMIFGKGSVPKDVIGPLLLLNEPDREDQSNISVETAIDIFSHTYQSKIGSPATASNPTMPGWFTNFMNAKPHIDFICVHWYGPPHISSLLNMVDKLYTMYQKPIWITEFAVAQWNTTKPMYTEKEVMDFMSQIIPELESRIYIERYAWKTRSETDINMGTSALFHDDGNLTNLGQMYSKF